MLLPEYLSKHSTQKELADALEVTPGLISQWINDVRPIPAHQCLAIERATGGRVTCEELRPDVNWKYQRQQAKAAA